MVDFALNLYGKERLYTSKLISFQVAIQLTLVLVPTFSIVEHTAATLHLFSILLELQDL